LVGLSPDQAQRAWERAVEKAGGRKISARLVKSAVQELQPAHNSDAVPRQTGPTRAEQRRVAEQSLDEILVLVRNKADYQTLIERLEVLHGQFRALFPRTSKR